MVAAATRGIGLAAARAFAAEGAHVIVTGKEDFIARTLEITNGRGVDVCYDGVGIDVFFPSFKAIRKYGLEPASVK